MERWFGKLHANPIPPLASGNLAIATFVRRDLLDEKVSVEALWQRPEPQRILRQQQLNGSWKYLGGQARIRTREDYNQLETYRNLGILVEEFGFTKKHAAIQRAADYLFSFQAPAGDFRGIYGDQYSPNYTAGITELLVKARYETDARIEKVFDWLVSIRQEDGGWSIPFRTRGYNLDVISSHSKTIQPDRSKPFSAMVTGVVLRAFAAHPRHRKSVDAHRAGELLLSRLFSKDAYPDRAGAEYWLRFSFPFWFTDLISALDSLSLLGFSEHEPHIAKALDWFVDAQQKNGQWELKILKGREKETLQAWLALAICRIFKRFSSLL